MIAGSVFVGHCQKCHAAIGEMTREELDFVVFNSDEQLLCFNCDEQKCDQFPEFFSDRVDGEKLTIDNESFVWDASVLRFFPVPHAHAHERTHARGLSSVTYLNRISKDSGSLFDLREGGECPNCKGLGYSADFLDYHKCSVCDGEGIIVKALFLPLWLVNGVRENA